MRVLRRVMFGLLGLAAVALTLLSVQEVRQRRSIELAAAEMDAALHPKANWDGRVLEKLAITGIDLSTIDRVEVHAVSPEGLRFYSGKRSGSLTELVNQPAAARAAEQAQFREEGRRFRDRTQQALFPTDPASTPEHRIIASHSLEKDQMRKIFGLWRAQLVDCDPDGFALCHAPNFALSLYSGQRLLLEASICWFCHNMYFFSGEKSTQCSFAVTTPASRTLKEALKSYFPGVKFPGLE